MADLFSKWCRSAKMYDSLPLLWFESGAPMLRSTVCCRCCSLKVVPQCEDVRFVAVVLVSKWCPRAKRYNLFPLLWSRIGAPMLISALCCRHISLEVVPPCEVVPQCDDRRFVAAALVSKWCSSANMYDLLPFFWSRSGAPVLRCTICCHCFGFEAVTQR